MNNKDKIFEVAAEVLQHGADTFREKANKNKPIDNAHYAADYEDAAFADYNENGNERSYTSGRDSSSNTENEMETPETSDFDELSEFDEIQTDDDLLRIDSNEKIDSDDDLVFTHERSLSESDNASLD